MPAEGTKQKAPEARGWVIGDITTVRGFKLAGLDGHVAESQDDVAGLLTRAREAGVALVVITDPLAARLDLGQLVAEHLLPLIAVVPSAAAVDRSSTAQRRVIRIVRSALGLPSRGQG